jgi:hypothetical protein
MNRLLPILALLIVCAASPLSGQSFGDYLGRFEFGFGGEGLDLNRRVDSTRTVDEEYTYYGGSIGWNLPVIQFARDLAIGFYPTIRVHGLHQVEGRDTRYGPQSTSSSTTYIGYYDPRLGDPNSHTEQELLITAPLLATLRYGTDATFRSRNRFGCGIGLGCQMVRQTTIDRTYWHPSVMGELSFRLPRGVVKLQFVRDFGYTAVDEAIQIKHWGFYVIFTDFGSGKW